MEFIFRKKGWDNCLTFFRELIMARIHDENETESVISEIKYTYEQYWKREYNYALRLEVFSDKCIKMYALNGILVCVMFLNLKATHICRISI